MSELQKSTNDRKIVVFDPTGPRKFEYLTSSSKWSDIASLLREEGVDMNKMEGTIKSTGNTLKLPEAQIPDGDQIIFLTLTKQSSGGVKEDFDSMSYNDLRRAAKELPEFEKLTPTERSSPSKDLLLKILKGTKAFKEAKPKEKKEVVKNYVKKAKETAPNLEERVKSLEEIVMRNDQVLYTLLFNIKKGLEVLDSAPVIREVPTENKAVKPVLSEKDTDLSSLQADYKKMFK